MKSTNLPCVKGTMGDWTYYATVMGIAELVKYVKFAEEVSPNDNLDLMIQREVSARSKQIAEYLRTNVQRFFGSLIVAAYDGQPHYVPISFGDGPLLSQLEGKVGILQFDGSEQYYAVDGQHRLAAMKEVVGEDSSKYKEDEVSVIVICHTKDSEGMERARRLFTTVNRYAKKTSPVTNIVMDEDDGIAIITRRLIREHPVFAKSIKVVRKVSRGPSKGQFKLATGEAMQPSDSTYLMAIGTFYKCTKALLPQKLKKVFEQQQQVPAYEVLKEGYDEVVKRWDALIEIIEPWQHLKTADATLESYRTLLGGHILVRPVGIASFSRAVPELLDNQTSIESIKRVVENFSKITHPPWDGVLWNSTSRRMIAGKSAENLAFRLWRYLLGLDEDYQRLQAEWKSQVDPQNKRTDLQLPASLNK